MLARLAPLFSHRRWPLALAALAVVLSLPALGGGINMDDYVLRAKMQGFLPIRPGSTMELELFRFMPGPDAENRQIIQAGHAPWWADPQLKLSFFRPLSSATHVLDNALWPDVLPLQHAHNLVWLFVGVVVVALLYRRVCGSPAAAGLAGLMFAIEDGHYIPVAWLSNRNALMALVLGIAAVVLHCQWRAAGTRSIWRLLLALAALAAGLLCAEVALGAVGYLAAYQLTLERDSAGRARPLLMRLLPLWPHLLLVLIWGLVYTTLGYGARGSGMYVDPVREPLLFLQAMAERIPILMLGQWFHGPIDLWIFMQRGDHLAMTAGGAVGMLVLGFLFAPLLRKEAEARFWALGMLFALVPVCGTFPMDRVLLLPGIGAFGLLACQVRSMGWLGVRADKIASRPAARASRRWIVGGLLVVHAVLAAPLLPCRVLTFRHLSDRMDADARSLAADAHTPQQTYVFLQAMETAYVYTPLVRWASGLPVPRRTATLSQLLPALTVSRPDRHSLVVRPEGGYFVYPGETLFRGSHRSFSPGQVVSTLDMDARVLEVTTDGRPDRVAFRFRVPLEHPSLRWFFIKDGHVQPFALPAVGQTRKLEAGIQLPRDMISAGGI